MRLHVIGCAGSFAGPRSAASSYLLEHTDAGGRTWRVLLDLGSGAFGPLQAAIDPATLDAVVLSHLHPDHWLDLTGLEVFWAYHERTDLPCLPVYGPSSLPRRMRAVMDRDTDLPDGAPAVPFEYRALAEGERFEIGPLRFETGLVEHPVEAYGFRITDDQGTVLAYSGDSDACPRLDELADGADLFLCEAGYIEGRDDRFTGVHLTGRRAGEAAQTARVGALLLTHVAGWTDPAVPLAEARSAFEGPITLAEPASVHDVVRAERASALA